MEQDQFCITFGKEEWSKFQGNKNHNSTNLNLSANAGPKKQASHQHTVSKTARSTYQTNNKATNKKNNIYKENNHLYDDFYQHPKPKHPSKNTPKPQPKNTNQTSKTKQITMNEALYPSHRANLYIPADDSPHVSFMQTVSKNQQRAKKYFQNYIDQQNPKQAKLYIDPLLDKYEIVKTAKKSYSAYQHQDKLTQYKQEMTKLDSLINRINQRIQASSAKFGI